MVALITNGEAGSSVRAKLNTLIEDTQRTRAELVTWAASNTPTDGREYSAAGLVYIGSTGATVIPDMPGLLPADHDWTPQHFGTINGLTDSAVIQAMWDATSTNTIIRFPPNINYGINATIDAPINYRTVKASGARFVARTDGASAAAPFVMFDLNPIADPANPETASQSYGFWKGGWFYHITGAPAGVAALKVYACRQMTVRDAIFGKSGATYLTSGIMVAGLGGHRFEKNRFIQVDVAFDGPDWSGGLTGAGIPISTTTYESNEFILSGAQKAWHLRGGWTAMKIHDGFLNGTTAAAIHLTNAKGSKDLLISGLRGEQAGAGGKYLHIEDTAGTAVSNVRLDGVVFDGNPAGGNHTHIALERVNRAVLNGVTTEADQSNSNYALSMDANCRGLEIDVGCRLMDFSLATNASLNINASVDREQIIFPDRKLTTPMVLSGYNGNSFSTTTATLDMSTLITGNRFPTHGVPPRGYTLWVQARDSDSAGTASRMVEIAKSAAEPATRRAIVDLDGITNDRRVQETVYAPADTNGDIWLDIIASGVNTLDLWVYVLEIHN